MFSVISLSRDSAVVLEKFIPIPLRAKSLRHIWHNKKTLRSQRARSNKPNMRVSTKDFSRVQGEKGNATVFLCIISLTVFEHSGLGVWNSPSQLMDRDCLHQSWRFSWSLWGANRTWPQNITYTLSEDISGQIIVEKNNIVIDGAGFTVGNTDGGLRGVDISGTDFTQGFCVITIRTQLSKPCGKTTSP